MNVDVLLIPPPPTPADPDARAFVAAVAIWKLLRAISAIPCRALTELRKVEGITCPF